MCSSSSDYYFIQGNVQMGERFKIQDSRYAIDLEMFFFLTLCMWVWVKMCVKVYHARGACTAFIITIIILHVACYSHLKRYNINSIQNRHRKMTQQVNKNIHFSNLQTDDTNLSVLCGAEYDKCLCFFLFCFAEYFDAVFCVLDKLATNGHMLLFCI